MRFHMLCVQVAKQTAVAAPSSRFGVGLDDLLLLG